MHYLAIVKPNNSIALGVGFLVYMSIAEPFYHDWHGFAGVIGHCRTIPMHLALCVHFYGIIIYFLQEPFLLPITLFQFKGDFTSSAYLKHPNAAITLLHVLN